MDFDEEFLRWFADGFIAEIDTPQKINRLFTLIANEKPSIVASLKVTMRDAATFAVLGFRRAIVFHSTDQEVEIVINHLLDNFKTEWAAFQA